MTVEATPTEAELAVRLAQLRSVTDRPQIVGAGALGDLLNFLSARLPVQLLRAAAIAFIGYQAWIYYATAQQMVADVASTRAKAQREKSQAEAVNQRFGVDIAQSATLKAELQKLQAEADQATAEAHAQSQNMNGTTVAIATKRAELAKVKGQINTLVGGMRYTVQFFSQHPTANGADFLNTMNRR